MMKELSVVDYRRLCSLSADDSLMSIRALYSILLDIKLSFLYTEVTINSPGPILLRDEKSFLNWVDSVFPYMAKYIAEPGIAEAFNEKEFPRFYTRIITPPDINSNSFSRIKGVEIWGEKDKIKQNYQKIEEVVLDKDLLTFYLSKNVFLQILDPFLLQDSRHNLIIKNASKIVLAYAGGEIKEFIVTDDNLVNVLVNKKLIKVLDTKSVLANAIEIFK